ncbi:MAG TPA: alpha/beta hydrolase [Burkholderiaceae bacterium]|nr:alpha/beta hydrolase [Burkholderiaceae bacterium]
MPASGNVPALEGVELRTVAANGIRLRYADAGNGPAVLFCHGFPESWYSWRHQIRALSQAGFRCVAPDMRGYGGSESPEDIERFTMLDLVGDMVALLRELDVPKAVVVGHDWGAIVAWHCALLRPDLFHAVVGMSVPFNPRGSVDFLSALRSAGIGTFYRQYFQEPGVAEAELERDVRASLRRIYFTASGDNTTGLGCFGELPPGKGLLDSSVDPEVLPDWLSEADLDWFASEFSRTGFRGGLNWYRNFTRNWYLMAPWYGQVIRQPSLFIAGQRDDVLRFPGAMKRVESFPTLLPGIRGCHLLEGTGHWVQQERPDDVNRLLLQFLGSLDTPS